MKVNIRYFAMLRDITKKDAEQLELNEGQNIEKIQNHLFEKYPKLSEFNKTVSFALNGEYARPDMAVYDGDELALLPPIAGG